MKITALLILTLTFFSCKKSNNEAGIVGNWELRKSEGGLAGTINYPPGNGVTYTFSANGAYSHSDSVSHYSGRYSIFPIGNGQYNLKLYNQSGDLVSDVNVRITATELVFLPPTNGADFPTDTYARL